MGEALPYGEDSIDLMLIGKSGNGKSSVGNTILNHRAFDISRSANSLTKISSCKWGYTLDKKKVIKIVDTPGMSEVAEENSKTMEDYLKFLPIMMGQCPKGFHALILVLKYGVRFTDEDQKAVATLRKMFGDNFIKDHCIIVITHGDKFELQYKNKPDAPTFDKWCKNQTGAFQELLKECDNRVILFYNTLKFDQKKKASVSQLLSSVNRISKRYTNTDFERCYEERERLLLEFQLPMISLKIQEQCSLLNALVSVNSQEDNFDENVLTFVSIIVKDLENAILTRDRNMGVLKNELKAVQDIKQQLENFDKQKSFKEQFEPKIRHLNFICEVTSELENRIQAKVLSVIVLEKGPGQAVPLAATEEEYELIRKTKSLLN